MITIKINNITSEGFVCPCPKIKCSNHGNCEECTKYHSISDGLPFCKRELGLFTRIFYKENYEMVQLLKREERI